MTNLNHYTTMYLSYCELHRKLSAKTLYAYRIDLKQFEEFAANYPSFLDKRLLNDFISHLNSNFSSKSVKRKIASIKAFYHYLLFEDIIDTNPFDKIDLHIKEPQPLPRVIPLHMIEALLNTIYIEETHANTYFKKKSISRDIAIVELLFATGMRISELCNLRREHLDMENCTITIWGKGEKERMIYLENPNVLHALTKYIDYYKDTIDETGGYLFINRIGQPISDQSVRIILNKYVEKAAIQLHITPHMFRHSFATLLLESDVDIRYIQKLLGHSSITTTQIYTSVSMAKQKEILTTKHPRNQIHIAK